MLALETLKAKTFNFESENANIFKPLKKQSLGCSKLQAAVHFRIQQERMNAKVSQNVQISFHIKT